MQMPLVFWWWSWWYDAIDANGLFKIKFKTMIQDYKSQHQDDTSKLGREFLIELAKGLAK